MEQATFPISKSAPMRPFLFTHLATSTPDSHQISKRIKGLLAHSEHYKGSPTNPGSSFPPLRPRDYRKARKLTLEICDLMVQADFLERFLKSQKNLQDVRIKVLTKGSPSAAVMKRLCEILSKISGVTRIHIDFDEKYMQHIGKAMAEFIMGMMCLRVLPRLKDFDMTVGGKQVFPLSASLIKLGFDSRNFQNANLLQKLVQRPSKFRHLDTIRVDCNPPNRFVDQGACFIIPKLPNFREISLNYSKDFCPQAHRVSNILDGLLKAPKFEILKFEFPMDGNSQITLLKHPIFKAKSLRRTSLSLFFNVNRLVGSDHLMQIFDLLSEVPALYELSLTFSLFRETGVEFPESYLEKITKITSIRKLKIIFEPNFTMLSEKQAGDLVRSIFNMRFLEELHLQLPQDRLGLKGQDLIIQGLRSLRKVTLHFEKPESEGDNDIQTIMEILGKCSELRELDFKLSDWAIFSQEMVMKLTESIGKLERLEILKFKASAVSSVTIDPCVDLVMTCHQLRYLQDLKIDFGPVSPREVLQNLQNQLAMTGKYRFLNITNRLVDFTF